MKKNTVFHLGSDSPSVGESSNIVISLANDLKPTQRKIFSDNYFASPEVLVFEKTEKIFAMSTLRDNRAKTCPVAKEAKLKKKEEVL